jgi:hypothetical protein
MAFGRPPSIQCICVSQRRRLNAIGQKKGSSHSLAITRYARNIDREKNKVKNHLFNIWKIGAMRQNLSSTEGHAELIA